MSEQYVRRCPACLAEHAPETMRCTCGVLLAGVDLVKRAGAPAVPAPAAVADAVASTLCPHEDCAQPNPAGASHCLYCDRPLHPHASTPGLMQLPSRLAQRYRIVEALPAKGAEAELLLVQSIEDDTLLVVKLYRQGIYPSRAVQERVARVDRQFRVEVLDAGLSDGHAYEVMEYCRFGSWRSQLLAAVCRLEQVEQLIENLAPAIGALHEAGLVHRDLKPENILLRSLAPLEAVLADFGIASVMDATQRFTGAARTLHYAPPESLSGVIDAKMDYWALGMIVLESRLGRHPFDGLSDAVILHHLATRAIDLSAVEPPRLRKLLGGLLQRDPALRWGGDELRRWLRRDPSLPEPAADGGSGFAQPYHLGPEQCHTPLQLGLALGRRWQEACADLANGQLLAWFRDVQKDQNTVRLLIELRHDRQLSLDMQLLRLILHLAPGAPPVWRGETIRHASVLERANRALDGDADAVHWLDQLYRQALLARYADAGNEEARALCHSWDQACERFLQAWPDKAAVLAKHGGDGRAYADFDALRYGGDCLDIAPLATAHARLLAAACDPGYLAALRQRLAAELIGLSAHCPWLAEWGDPATMNEGELVAVDCMLTQARKAAAGQEQAEQRAREQESDDLLRFRAELEELKLSIQHLAAGSLDTQACGALRRQLERYFELLGSVRAGAHADPAWQELSKALGQHRKSAERMLALLDQLGERDAENRGWLNPNLATVAVVVGILLMRYLGPRMFFILLGSGAALLFWRFYPGRSMRREIRALAKRMQVK